MIEEESYNISVIGNWIEAPVLLGPAPSEEKPSFSDEVLNRITNQHSEQESTTRGTVRISIKSLLGYFADNNQVCISTITGFNPVLACDINAFNFILDKAHTPIGRLKRFLGIEIGVTVILNKDTANEVTN